MVGPKKRGRGSGAAGGVGPAPSGAQAMAAGPAQVQHFGPFWRAWGELNYELQFDMMKSIIVGLLAFGVLILQGYIAYHLAQQASVDGVDKIAVARERVAAARERVAAAERRNVFERERSEKEIAAAKEKAEQAEAHRIRMAAYYSDVLKCRQHDSRSLAKIADRVVADGHFFFGPVPDKLQAESDDVSNDAEGLDL